MSRVLFDTNVLIAAMIVNHADHMFRGNNRPAAFVYWHEAVEFCNRLKNHTKRPYRLPSEAE